MSGSDSDVSRDEPEKLILTDAEKKRMLDDVKESMNSLTLMNDSHLAERMKRVTKIVSSLVSSSKTTSDVNFAMNVLDCAVDCATTHLENSDPARELFQECCIADGESMSSWCPGGYIQLVTMTKGAIPYRPSFQKDITAHDLEKQHAAQNQETPTAEKKVRKRRATLVKGPVTAPLKITTVETEQVQKTNMHTAYEILVKHASQAPIPFFHYVINPRSFVQTCYNIFLVSFLVHERLAYLAIGHGHELLIGPKLSENCDSDDFTIETIQLIQSLSARTWCELVERLNITEALLPDFCPKQSPYFDDGQLAHELASNVVFLDP